MSKAGYEQSVIRDAVVESFRDLNPDHGTALPENMLASMVMELRRRRVESEAQAQRISELEEKLSDHYDWCARLDRTEREISRLRARLRGEVSEQEPVAWGVFTMERTLILTSDSEADATERGRHTMSAPFVVRPLYTRADSRYKAALDGLEAREVPNMRRLR